MFELKADGKVFEAGDGAEEISRERLVGLLRQAKEQDPEAEVGLSADAGVDHGLVVELVELVRRAGIENVAISNTGTAAGEASAGGGLRKAAMTKFVEIEQPEDRAAVIHRLSTSTAGIVREVAAKRGATVKKGDVLLRLDSRLEEAALKIAEIRAHGLEREWVAKERAVEARSGSREGMPALATQLAVARAELGQAQIAVERLSVLAPVDGTIVGVKAKVGEYVTPQMPAINLQRAPRVRVRGAPPARGR